MKPFRLFLPMGSSDEVLTSPHEESSDGRDERSVVADDSMFHDLEKMYPDAPIPEEGVKS